MHNYSNMFYKDQKDGSLRSSEHIVPLIIDIVKPKSVVDIGCGIGTWLSTFKANGIDDVLGVDGNHVGTDNLLIPKDLFLRHNLDTALKLDKKFDLAISLEVAEHIKNENSETFIESIISLSDIVVFSAAIPFQGGENHINEQWPDFWVSIFEKKGYVLIDCLRDKIWNNENVEYFYAQNILLFINNKVLDNYPELKIEQKNTRRNQLSLVHPRKFVKTCAPEYMSIKKILHWQWVLLKLFPKAVFKAIQRRI